MPAIRPTPLPADRGQHAVSEVTLAMSEDSSQSLNDEATSAGRPKRAVAADDISFGDERTTGGGLSGQDTLIDGIESVDLEARYRIEGTLGQGGMGEVLLATDTRLDRKVAIKRILGEAARSRTAVLRFLTEAKAIAALSHPNVVQIHDYGRDAAGPFLIMEYVDGGSLLDRCRQGPIPLEEAVELACHVCDGLAKAHDQQIIHRDIKPANILLTSDGIPKLTDFGLAKSQAVNHGHTVSGAVMGTPDFMPPEQRRDASEVDHRSDLWSLAATVYQMVTGRSPRIIRFNDIPAALQSVLGKALEDSKEARYQSARDLRDAIKGSLRAAASLAATLEQGRCPACGTPNESTRKFCRNSECAAPLEAACLSCNKPMPLWEEVCGDCGARQSPLVASRRGDMAADQARAEGLLGDLAFSEAAELAARLRDESHPRLAFLRPWADRFLQQVEASRSLATERAVASLAEAAAHESAFDYSSAIAALEPVPDVMRSVVLPGSKESLEAMLRRVTQKQAESHRLEAAIKERIAAKSLDGLLREVEKLVELRPDRRDIIKLRQQLVDREQRQEAARLDLQQRQEATRDDSLAAARSLMASHDYRGAIEALANVPAAVVTAEVELVRREAETAARQAETLADTIREAVAAGRLDGLLDTVDACLKLLPADPEILEVRRSLVARDEQIATSIAEAQARSEPLWLACRFAEAAAAIEQAPADRLPPPLKKALGACRELARLRPAAMAAVAFPCDPQPLPLLGSACEEYRQKVASHRLVDAEFTEAYARARAALDAAVARGKQHWDICDFKAALGVWTAIPETARNRLDRERIDTCRALAARRETVIQTAERGLGEGDCEDAREQCASYLQRVKDLSLVDQQCGELLGRLDASIRATKRAQALVRGASLVAATLVVVVALAWGVTSVQASRRKLAIEQALAASRWDAALALDPRNMQALLGRAKSRIETTPPAFDAAFQDIDEAERLDPASTRVRMARVSALLARARTQSARGIAYLDAALKDIAAAAALEPDSEAVRAAKSSAILVRAKDHAKSDRLKQAQSDIAEAIALGGLDAEINTAVDAFAAGWIRRGRAAVGNGDVAGIQAACVAASKAGADRSRLSALWEDYARDRTAALDLEGVTLACTEAKNLGLSNRAIGEMWMGYAAAAMKPPNQTPQGVWAAIEKARAAGVLDTRLNSLRAKANILEAAALQSQGRIADFTAKVTEAYKCDAQAASAVLDSTTNARLREAAVAGYYSEFNAAVRANDWAAAMEIAGHAGRLRAHSTAWIEAAVSSIPPNRLPLQSFRSLPSWSIGKLRPLRNSISMDLRLIPPGTFMMGDPKGPATEAQREMRIEKPFYLGAYEVTNAQWIAVMGNPQGDRTANDIPVQNANRDMATEFYRRLSALPEEQKAGRVYRLPSEAEWEYACRAGATTRYSFGDDESQLGNYGWFDGNSGAQANPVGRKLPNAWGLFDMHGNVWESTSDHWDQQSLLAIQKGGCWNSSAWHCQSSRRASIGTDYVILKQLGFRVAMSLAQTDSSGSGPKDASSK